MLPDASSSDCPRVPRRTSYGWPRSASLRTRGPACSPLRAGRAAPRRAARRAVLRRASLPVTSSATRRVGDGANSRVRGPRRAVARASPPRRAAPSGLQENPKRAREGENGKQVLEDPLGVLSGPPNRPGRPVSFIEVPECAPTIAATLPDSTWHSNTPQRARGHGGGLLRSTRGPRPGAPRGMTYTLP